MSDYNCTKWFVKNEATDAPIIFEEFVMIMINEEQRHQTFRWKNALLQKDIGSWSYNYFVPFIVSTNQKDDEYPNF